MDIMMLDVGNIHEIHHLMFFIQDVDKNATYGVVASGKHSAEEWW